MLNQMKEKNLQTVLNNKNSTYLKNTYNTKNFKGSYNDIAMINEGDLKKVYLIDEAITFVGKFMYTYKDKFISEYTKEDFTLLLNRHGLGFHFDNTKVVKGTHNLTISIYFENGKKLSTTQTVKFN